MLGRLSTAAMVAVVLAAPAHGAATDNRSLLMPGVSYTREVDFTPHGPVIVHIVNAPRPGGLYALRTVLSNGALVGRERLTEMERAVTAQATAAGVSGDLFDPGVGRPSGVVIRSGVLESPPLGDRSSVGVGGDGTVHVDRIGYASYWAGNGQRRPLLLNRAPTANGVSLFTSAYGPATPRNAADVEAVIPALPPLRPNVEVAGQIAQIGSSSGGTAIPPGGAVISARGTGAAKLAAEAPAGTTVAIRFNLVPSWDGVVDAIGGGPALVRDGRPVFRANEQFSSDQLFARSARTAVGQRADGRVLLVTVDGDQPGYSVGMTTFELALTMARLGCVTASGLGAGDAATAAFDGQLLNRPSGSGETPVADALLVLYTGVYAPPAAEPVLSPNGDSIADRQTLAYRLVRPADVAATLIAPDGSARQLDVGRRGAGTYTFPWTGTTSAGTPEAEGVWRFSVTAVDDAGERSAADRYFSLNDTLGFLRASPDVLRLGHARLRASFQLAHPARVTANVETQSGLVIRILVRRDLDPGTYSLVWTGRGYAGRLAFGGRYVLRVAAVNGFGRVDLSYAFSARR